MTNWHKQQPKGTNQYEWPKPRWADGYSRHGYYFSAGNSVRDRNTSDIEQSMSPVVRAFKAGRHADFHWKMDNPPRGVTVD